MDRPNHGSLVPHAKVALTIAGSDPSGGAGLQADLKTFHQFGIYGMSVVTLVTVQNTQTVTRVEVLPTDLILQQLEAVLSDIQPYAIKLGALGNAEVIRAVSERLKSVTCPIVVDPVIVSKHGHILADDDAVEAYRRYLLPLADVVTPNRHEVEKLAGEAWQESGSQDLLWNRLRQTGAKHFLVKASRHGDHHQHYLTQENDVLYLSKPTVASNHLHGAGCVLAAALTSHLAMQPSPYNMLEAVQFAIDRAYEAITASTLIGSGIHPAETRAMRFR